MALRREVQHRVAALDRLRRGVRVGDIALDERVPRVALAPGEVLEVARVGEHVEVHDLVRIVLVEHHADQVRTDEPRAARDQDLLHASAPVSSNRSASSITALQFFLPRPRLARNRDRLREVHHAVRRSLGRPRELIRRAGVHRGARADRVADLGREAVPGALAPVAPVECPAGARVEQRQRRARELPDARRPPPLIVHDPQLLLRSHQRHHRAHEVLPPGAVEPTRPDQQMLTARLPEERLPRRLRTPVRVHRADGVIHRVRRGPEPIEDIIRAVVHQDRAALAARAGQIAHGLPVQTRRRLLAFFGPVDIRPRRAVDDDIPVAPRGPREARGVGHVERGHAAGGIRRHVHRVQDAPPGRDRLARGAPEHPGGTDHEHAWLGFCKGLDWVSVRLKGD
jgi:hypothetical protein